MNDNTIYIDTTKEEDSSVSTPSSTSSSTSMRPEFQEVKIQPGDPEAKTRTLKRPKDLDLRGPRERDQDVRNELDYPAVMPEGNLRLQDWIAPAKRGYDTSKTIDIQTIDPSPLKQFNTPVISPMEHLGRDDMFETQVNSGQYQVASNDPNFNPGPVEIDTNHPDAISTDHLVSGLAPIEINTNHPAAMFVHGIRPKIQNTNTHEAPNDTVRPGESNLGDKLATFDEGLATALHTAHEFFKGGLYQVAKDKGVELPAWTHSVAGVLNNPDYNQAMSQGAFLTYGKAAGLNKDNMLKAIDMKEAGKTDTQIFKATRAELYEGKWGERVPYSELELKVKPEQYHTFDHNGTDFVPTGKSDFYNIPKETTLGEVVKHDKLFEADPSLKDIRVRAMTQVEQDRYSPNTFGFAEVTNNTIVIRPHLNAEDFKKSLVHETEHIVQEKHGLPQGSSPEAFQDATYRKFVAEKQTAYLNLVDKVQGLKAKGQALNIPDFTSDNVKQLIDLVYKAKKEPHSLNVAETAAYKDMVKHGLSRQLNELENTTENVLALDIANMRKYRVTKGEVGARVGEQELGLPPDIVNKIPYKKSMESMVPEKQRINGPLDPGGVPASQDFGSVYRYQGHYLNPDQAKKLYTAKPELRPVPPGFTQEHVLSMDAKQYLGLVDYLKKDSTYKVWMVENKKWGYTGPFPSNTQLEAVLKKLGIK